MLLSRHPGRARRRGRGHRIREPDRDHHGRGHRLAPRSDPYGAPADGRRRLGPRRCGHRSLAAPYLDQNLLLVGDFNAIDQHHTMQGITAGGALRDLAARRQGERWGGIPPGLRARGSRRSRASITRWSPVVCSARCRSSRRSTAAITRRCWSRSSPERSSRICPRTVTVDARTGTLSRRSPMDGRTLQDIARARALKLPRRPSVTPLRSGVRRGEGSREDVRAAHQESTAARSW